MEFQTYGIKNQEFLLIAYFLNWFAEYPIIKLPGFLSHKSQIPYELLIYHLATFILIQTFGQEIFFH